MLSRGFFVGGLACIFVAGLGGLAGCTGSTSSSSVMAVPSGQGDLSLDTPQKIMAADVQDPRVQSALADIAVTSTGATAQGSGTLRYLALRRLESGGAAVPVAEKLAETTETTNEARFLQENAVAVLLRGKTPEAKAALARAEKANLQAAIVGAKLAGRSGS